MRRLTLQGAARWHQHSLRKTCLPSRSPSFFTAPRAISTTPKLYSKDEKQDFTVRTFEQSIHNSEDRFEVTDTLQNAEDAEVEKVKAELKDLDHELEIYQKGLFSPDGEFMRSLSDDDRKRALDAINKYAAQHNWKEEDERDERRRKLLDADIERMLSRSAQKTAEQQRNLWDPEKDVLDVEDTPLKESYEVELKVPESHHAFVINFNKALKTLAGSPSLTEKEYAWKSYRRCKEALPFFLDIATEESMVMLWKSQRPSSVPSERISPRHLIILAEDILTSGRVLETAQWNDYLDALLLDERHEKALKLWREREPDLPQYTVDEKKNYWDLGVRLFVANSEPKMAQNAAIVYLSLDPSYDPRILIPVIDCWARTDNPESDVRAWTLYLYFKTALGTDINMRDYDAISIGLLKSGKVGLAVAVFKDMMLTGQNSTAESDSLYKASLGLVGKLQSSSINESDVNRVSLASLTILPRKLQNKFFYASWIKKLIGMNELDAAAKVVELMYERGVKPDAKHLNGLIGAWLREGSTSGRQKAEGLGWGMIQERIDRVWGDHPGKPSIKEAQPEGDPIPEFIQRTTPAGNIETFSILLLHYTRRSNDSMVTYLVECLDKSQIRPNAFFANHLLYRELRKQNILGVWTGYKNMMSTIKPDLETFACLWDCGKIQYDRTRCNFNAQYPSARALYSEMNRWYSDLPSRLQQGTQNAFSKDLYDHIIRCFCLSLDPQGTIVALRAMRQTFGYHPDASTARILVFLVVRLIPIGNDSSTVPKRRHRRISSTPRAKENLQYVGGLLDKLRDQKTVQAAKEGVYLDEMNEEFREEFEVDLMCDLLRIVLRSLPRNPTKIEDSIQKAANEMGMGDLYLGEPPSYYI